MPTYEFNCLSSRCRYNCERFDVRLPMADRDAACVRCPNCNSPARRCEVPFKAPAVVMMRALENGGKVPDRLLP